MQQNEKQNGIMVWRIYFDSAKKHTECIEYVVFYCALCGVVVVFACQFSTLRLRWHTNDDHPMVSLCSSLSFALPLIILAASKHSNRTEFRWLYCKVCCIAGDAAVICDFCSEIKVSSMECTTNVW